MHKYAELKCVIDEVSAVYRQQLNTLSRMRNDLAKAMRQMEESKKNHYCDMSHDVFVRLTEHIAVLKDDIDRKQAFCDGISAAREILMDERYGSQIQ